MDVVAAVLAGSGGVSPGSYRERSMPPVRGCPEATRESSAWMRGEKEMGGMEGMEGWRVVEASGASSAVMRAWAAERMDGGRGASMSGVRDAEG